MLQWFELTVLIRWLASLGRSTLGRRLQAVIPGSGIRTWLLLGKGLLWLLPMKKAMRVHPLALVTCSRASFCVVSALLSAFVTDRGGHVIVSIGRLVVHLVRAMKLVSVTWCGCRKLLKLLRMKVRDSLCVWLVWKPTKTMLLLLVIGAVFLSIAGCMNLLALLWVQVRVSVDVVLCV